MKVVGEKSRAVLKRAWDVLMKTKNPVALVGPTGTGKTLIGMTLMRAYGKRFNVPTYYVQLGPDVSRTTLVGGFRMLQGSLVPVKGVIMRAMDEGGVVFLDEFTHAHPEEMVALNSALSNDELKVVGLGEIASRAKSTTRFILAHNPHTYHGNHPLPVALRRRVVAIWVDFPGYEEEVEIAMEMLRRVRASASEGVVRFLMSVVVDCRTEDAPLCASNVVAAATLVESEYLRRTPVEVALPEPVAVGLYESVHRRLPGSVSEVYADSCVRDLAVRVTTLGTDFPEIVMSAMMGPYLPPKVRDKLLSKLSVEGKADGSRI